MIKIKNDNDVITISGHADYSNGEDIVCASVSSIMYTTVNALLRLDRSSIEYSDTNNVVTIKLIKKNEVNNELILNMLSLFNELSTKYPKNIKIESEE